MHPRRLVPDPVATAIAERRGRAAWEHPPARERARRAIRAITGRDDDALARAHLVETAVREQLIWRPWQIAGGWRDREHLDAALARGRGVIASWVHTGPFAGTGMALQRVAPTTSIAGPWFFEDHPYESRNAQWRRNAEGAGITVLPAAGSFARIADILRSGGLVSLAFDAPGPRATAFLGRSVGLGDGTARLALETGAAIVPVSRGRRRWRPFTVAHPPLEGDAHDVLAEIHSRWVLSRPAELEDPVRPGWWGGVSPRGAT